MENGRSEPENEEEETQEEKEEEEQHQSEAVKDDLNRVANELENVIKRNTPGQVAWSQNTGTGLRTHLPFPPGVRGAHMVKKRPRFFIEYFYLSIKRFCNYMTFIYLKLALKMYMTKKYENV